MSIQAVCRHAAFKAAPMKTRKPMSRVLRRSCDLADILIDMGNRSCLKPVFVHWIRGLAFCIDGRWRALRASSSALWEKKAGLHTRRDPNIRRDLVHRKVGSGAATSRKRKAWSEPVYERAIEQHRYFMAACKVMDGAKQVALVCDDSHIPRRDRLCGALMNLDSGACCWLPPQDSL